VQEVRQEILNGEKDYTYLIESNPGAIKAQIVEQDGKTEDIMAIDPKFYKRIEKLYPGRDFKSPAN